MDSSDVREEELDAALAPNLEKFWQVWQEMGMSKKECLERELAVLEQVATLLAKMETEEKALLLSVNSDVEMTKRKVELLQSELHLEKQNFTVDRPLTLVESAKYYNELLNLLEAEKVKRMELYGKLESKLASVCSRLGEEREKPESPKMKIKYEEHLKRNEKMRREQLLRLEQCWDNCKIKCSDRIAFLNSTADKSESEVGQVFEDEIQRLDRYYAQRKDIFDQVDRWIALWKKKVDMEGNTCRKHRERTNESIDQSSLGQQLMEMQLDIKSSVEAWRRKNPGQMLLYEEYFYPIFPRMSRDKADVQQFRMIADQLRRELYIKRVLVSEAAKDLIKYVTEHQREDVLVSGFTSLKENPFRPKSSLSCVVL
ncbi:G-gamma and MAP65 ASE1 domain containing protein [Trichuris trichiura]|uniref:Guanine nucleotide-binding protein subunit gamma n=1 Tax=Trichuris trichiura TaxID=36087 RepID=A0A077YVW1_TRITR|nr:G-gamma and MAP65 ASE1 domain containing protein [Trichuris trichiura]